MYLKKEMERFGEVEARLQSSDFPEMVGKSRGNPYEPMETHGNDGQIMTNQSGNHLGWGKN